MERCVICNKEFKSPRGLANHYRIHNLSGLEYKELYNKINNIEPVENVDFVVCKICGKETLDLSHHLKIHSMNSQEYLSLYPEATLTCEKSLKRKSESSKRSQNITDKRRKASSENITKYNKSEDKFTDELRNKLSKNMHDRLVENWKNSEYRKQMCEERISRCNSPEYKEKIAKISRDKWQMDKEYRTMMLRKFQCKLKEYEPGVRLRSSYEYEVYKFLTSLNIHFEYEALVIEYQMNGLKKFYKPDFFIPEYNLIIEVKPFKFVNAEINQLKKKASLNSGYNFVFATENEIYDTDKMLELIKKSSTTIESVAN